MQMIQPIGDFIEEGITLLMAVTVINTAKLMDSYGNNLKLLPTSQSQLDFLVKTYAVSAGSEDILLHSATLEVHQKDDVNSYNNASVEQDLWEQKLIHGEQ